MARANGQITLDRLASDNRELASSDSEAEELIESCTDLFHWLAGHPSLADQRSDDAIFNASFDLGDVLRRYEVKPDAVRKLLAAIRDLFARYFAETSAGLSCQQMWDNLIGYAEWADAPASGQLFVEESRAILADLLNQAEPHVRSSAIHGLNHYPDMEAAAGLLQDHLPKEDDPAVRAYCGQVLQAFGRDERMI